ncbi:MAG: N-acetyltransferase [Fibrobacterales bacterium]
MSFFIHESSIVDTRVTIGSGTKVWHFSHIMHGVTIGENCSFGQNCVVGPNVTIGTGVKVQNNVSIYEGVEIEDSVFLGPSMVFTNVTNPRSFIIRKDEFQKTLLKIGSSIGANATIICGVTIGRYALVGAGSVITKDIPDFGLAYGVPAKLVGWVSKAGNQLNFKNSDSVIDSSDGSRYLLKNNIVIEENT